MVTKPSTHDVTLAKICQHCRVFTTLVQTIRYIYFLLSFLGGLAACILPDFNSVP